MYLDITIHVPNDNDLATMEGISSSDEEEAKMLISSLVLQEEIMIGQCKAISSVL